VLFRSGSFSDWLVDSAHSGFSNSQILGQFPFKIRLVFSQELASEGQQPTFNSSNGGVYESEP
jgi:hypothetical protein